MSDKRYNGLDNFRIIAALLIVSVHTFPLTSVSIEADFILTRVLARISVPFFLMISGFFIFQNSTSGKIINKAIINKSIKKTAIIYCFAILLYIPVNIYTGALKQQLSIIKLLKQILFEGTFYHLWYLPASILGVLTVSFLFWKLGLRKAFAVTIILYLIALLGDSYYGLTVQITLIRNIYEILFMFFNYTRNGLLMTPVFLVMGGIIAVSGKQFTIKTCLAGLVVSMVLLITEGSILHRLGWQRHDSMYIALLPGMFFLFHLLLNWKCNDKTGRIFRTLSMWIYIVHPMCIIAVRGIAKVVNMTSLLVDNSIIHYLSVVLTSLLVSIFFICFSSRKNIKGNKARAWAEIDMESLQNNIHEIKKILPNTCNIMAVVKANAYGHGDKEIARELNKNGVNAFAVAVIEEGVRLRKYGVNGEILILGYTFPEEFVKLKQYNLTQTVIDSDYATLLNSENYKIKVHIKIDTGMHRLGENHNNLAKLINIYKYENLIVCGTFTHLSSADSLEQKDVDFTKHQIEVFYRTLDKLRENGINPKKIHIQSSYGVLNYPYLICDYARIGIAMYGVLSNLDHETRMNPELQPVLSVKARVVLTKEILKNESVGYNRQFTADENTRIAVISIGYADGIPSILAGGKGHCLLKGRKSKIIGKICMDQLIVDITDIPDVKPGDIATLIGRDGTEYISAESVAEEAGTLTNELLSRLGSRVSRNYKYYTGYSLISTITFHINGFKILQ